MAAKKGSNKARSLEQEKHVAEVLGGTYSPSSGAAVTDNGDVRGCCWLAECKTSGTSLKPAKSISVKVADLLKITDEAWSEGRSPLLALRVHFPGTVLSDKNGDIDLVVRLLDDVAEGICFGTCPRNNG